MSSRKKEGTIYSIFMATINNEYTEVLKLCDNGDIFLKGKLIHNDKEVAEVIIEFFKKSRLF